MNEHAKSPHVVLCLSGGGLRATFFHLGVIQALRATGELQKVTHICSVSGGSILAAHLVLNWDAYTGTTERFRYAAYELIALAGRDIRGRIVTRWLLAWFVPFLWPFFRWFRRTTLLQSEYDRFYAIKSNSASLFDLSRHLNAPKLHILATSFTTGNLCSFSQDGFSIEYPNGPLPPRKRTILVSEAVAASSAFPPLFPPVIVTRASLGLEEQEFSYPEERLTDGGVFDNSGFEKFLKLRNVDRTFGDVILSDAGASFDWKTGNRFFWIISRTSRATDILMKRVADQTLAGAKLDKVRVRHIQIAADEKSPHGFLPIEVQRPLAKIRTDLDRFSKLEWSSLVLHGLGSALTALKPGTPPFLPQDELDLFSLAPRDAKSIMQAETELQQSTKRRLFRLNAGDLLQPFFVISSVFAVSILLVLVISNGFLLYRTGPDLFKVVWNETVRRQITDEASRQDAMLSIVVLPDASARTATADLARELRESSLNVALGETLSKVYLSSNGTAQLSVPYYLRRSPVSISLDSRTFAIKNGVPIYSIPPGPIPVIVVDVTEKPKTLIREKIVSRDLLRITSGGTSDGKSPFCQPRSATQCITPQRGGKLVVGTGSLDRMTSNGGPRSTYKITVDTPEQICIQVNASTGACETEIYIQGFPSAIESFEAKS